MFKGVLGLGFVSSTGGRTGNHQGHHKSCRGGPNTEIDTWVPSIRRRNRRLTSALPTVPAEHGWEQEERQGGITTQKKIENGF